MFEKLVVITKKTPLEELIERFNSRAQSQFYLKQSGVSFSFYEEAHMAYKRGLDDLKKLLPKTLKQQWIDRSFLPHFLFGEKDLVLTLGPDGLVVNTAKYLDNQPLLAVNPDPDRIDGILIPFAIAEVGNLLEEVLDGRFLSKKINMAQATLNNGQTLYGVNDLFIGQKTHLSARYKIVLKKREEQHSSSGIIVSTGVGSTGWFQSVVNGSLGVAKEFGVSVTNPSYVFSSLYENHL